MFTRQKAQGDPEGADVSASWRDEMRRRAQEPIVPAERPRPRPRPSDTSSAASSAGSKPAKPSKPSGSNAPEDADPGTEPTTGGPQAPSEIETMLARLDSLGSSEPTSDLPPTASTLAREASSHSEALREALRAREEAQGLLEVATKERAEATSRAEQILLEARAMAKRLRQEAEDEANRTRRETAAWANDQRHAVEEVIAELTDTAAKEASLTRQEALEHALAEADEIGAAQAAELVAAGRADADAIRLQAREQLDESTSLIAQTQVSVALFAESVTGFMSGLMDNARRLERLLAEVDVVDETPADADADDDLVADADDTDDEASADAEPEPEPEASDDDEQETSEQEGEAKA